MISWREHDLKLVQGKAIKTPDNNYFAPINDTSETSWQNTLKKLEDSQFKWIDFLKKFQVKDFEKVDSINNMTYYEYIHGVIQHDAYHLGQIVLLKKSL